ncbi:hypothetical protein AB0G60_31160 [Streptomyces angustmyceticus]|uniref:Uncharacterized protein n=1 Tax=Streptomyces angustmyceticus TaxID=285578 RepID=A0A5J4LIK2_9ACTN|nr:hypothetical protein [Streptomyces angustmyceticus]UAL68964.1 hypothetical protein K7396_22540 [Streptomyces angustmyceticus]GES34037.1 hypothetical protein San01_65250 [Streptomyces angustmyceticus]
MNGEIQLTCPRERFYRRERRSVPLAREFVRVALKDWGVGERADAVLLCVSELADKWGERRPGKIVWCEFAV